MKVAGDILAEVAILAAMGLIVYGAACWLLPAEETEQATMPAVIYAETIPDGCICRWSSDSGAKGWHLKDGPNPQCPVMANEEPACPKAAAKTGGLVA
jgi:hypothetical protein